ncbi:PRC-barrel domain-containing protein [Aromatoleum diolicum]|uniref:PRC-barrel domain containing protein n=1 Tax=Aromatoleum diolicum TaxID=75796 RepID=A0ABX1Q6P4_9RHOO|nr:PRC-barrel domain-containing protein [Aromatoleum diolicum]NMG73983.1 PRC-barrel domain containing protein [Aromatoleum diolicum]
MTYETLNPAPRLLSATSLMSDAVYNHKEEKLGDIKDMMLNIHSGTVSYAVLSFGGFLGMGEKLFAVPWSALTLDTVNKRFVLNVETDSLENAPGFDKDHWPDMADPTWAQSIHTYYGTQYETQADPDKPNVPLL